jgi:hypothetical protein
MSFDVVTAALRCRSGHPVPEGETAIQVRIQPSPEGALLRVGDRLDVRDPLEGPYLRVREPAPGEELRVLEAWSCPVCGAGFNWALITIRDDEWLQAVESVELTLATLDRAHYVTDQLRFVYSLYTGQEMFSAGAFRPDWLPVLRAALSA